MYSGDQMRLQPGQRANLADLGPTPISVHSDNAALMIAVRVGSTVEELLSVHDRQGVGSRVISTQQCLINLADIPAVVDEVNLIAHSPRALSGTVQIGSAQYDLAELGPSNTSGVFGRFYRHNGQWRYAAMNLGFPALEGLAGLLNIPVARLSPPPSPARPQPADSQVAPRPAAKPPAAGPAPTPTPPPTSGFLGRVLGALRSATAAPPIATIPPSSGPTPTPAASAPQSALSLRKETVRLTLEKKGVTGLQARVMLVMDSSGSMVSLYSQGKVQHALERLVPVAMQLDDNGEMEFFFYASKFSKQPNLTEKNVFGRIGKHYHNKDGIGNNEPPVMEAVLREHRQERSSLPTLVLFVTDGGIDAGTSKKIEKILKDSAPEGLFWQFVGLGNANYGILERFDTLRGRVIDNSGFFAVDDLDRISDAQLYERLLSEFPDWIRKAKGAGILR